MSFLKDPLGFLINLSRQGSLARYRFNFRNHYFMTDPDQIRDFFVRDYAKFDKSTTLVKLREAFGSGLVTCPFADHKRQRRQVQPAFTASSLEAYGEVIPEIAKKHVSKWSANQVIDLTGEMDKLTFKIAARTLFEDEDAENQELEDQIEHMHRNFTPGKMILSSLLPQALFSRFFGFGAVRKSFEKVTAQMIERGLRDGFSKKNLLSILIESMLAEGVSSQYALKAMTGQIINMLLASEETVATTMNWAWYVLSKHQDIQAKLQQEVDRVFGGRAPTVDKLPELTYMESVIKETMRMFPAIWAISRVAREDYHVGGQVIPKGSIVLVSSFVTQRDSRYFPDPLSFKPERWDLDAQSGRPEFSYFPFGGGPRGCIGAGFAMMEMKMVLSTILQKWNLQPVASDARVEFQPLITLRPKNHILMRVTSRHIDQSCEVARVRVG